MWHIDIVSNYSIDINDIVQISIDIASFENFEYRPSLPVTDAEMRGTNDAFRFLVFCFVSAIATKLVFYLLDLLLQFDLPLHVSYPINDRFTTSIDIEGAILVTSLILLVLSVYCCIKRTGQRFSLSISFLVLLIVFLPIPFSYLRTGYVLSSVIISSLLCMYTVIAIIVSQIPIGRPLKTNPNKCKQGKSNLIYYEYTELLM